MEKLHHHLHGETLTSEEIVKAWGERDPLASRTIDVYVDLLASPLALVANVTGCTIMPTGGGLSNSAELLAEIDHALRAASCASSIAHCLSKPSARSSRA